MRTKSRIEDIEEIRALYAEGLELKSVNRGMTFEQVAAHLGMPYGTWKRWRTRFLAEADNTIPNDP